MNAEYDENLEAGIDRELKSLPVLAAPPTLAPRVMAAIASRSAAPWYRRAWPTWSVGLQLASLAVLLVMFGGLCFAGWQISHAASVNVALQKVEGAFSALHLAWRTLDVIVDAALQVIRHLGTGFICALMVMGLAVYALLLGIGSACYRLAYARR